jgi:hypothetical protein
VRRDGPAWNQATFRWVWHDPSDDRPDGPKDDDPSDLPPPLRDRVRQRHADNVVSLWGWPVRLVRPSGDDRNPESRSERPEPGWRLTERIIRASPG